jgi:hypothetical protein
MNRAFLLFVSIVLAGCGGSSTVAPPPPPPPPSVTSISIAPTSANVAAGQQQQFTATVSGTGNFNTAVTWSVAGDGTINSSGLFTAGTTSGSATVQAASVETPTVINSAAITVSATQADLGDWYGTVTPTGGATSMPVDFHLAQNGTALGTSNQATNVGFGPVSLITNQAAAFPPCYNLDLPSKPAVGNFGSQISPNSQLNNTHISLSGTVNGNGQMPGAVSLSLQLVPGTIANATENLTLAGQFDPTNSILSGTYTNTGFLAGCFQSQTSGTFSFTKYVNLASAGGLTYKGSFAYGTAGQVPITLTSGPLGVFTLGAIPGVCASAVSVNLRTDVSNGRYFHLITENFTQSDLEVWGISNDSQGLTITVYTALMGTTPTESPCITNAIGFNNLVSNVTLTKQ